MKVLEAFLSCLYWGVTSHFEVGSISYRLFFPYPLYSYASFI